MDVLKKTHTHEWNKGSNIFISFSRYFVSTLVPFQVTQAKSSVAMEPMGFKQGLDRLLDEGIPVKVITTDRHPSIRKIIREEYPEVTHQFDPWHVTKGLFVRAPLCAAA